MRLAIVGSRNLTVHRMGDYVGEEYDEILSGGARGIDTCASLFAAERGLRLTVFLPDYEKYGRAAPIIRNREIVDAADAVLVFWDGASRGTQSVIRYCEKKGVRCRVIRLDPVPNQ